MLRRTLIALAALAAIGAPAAAARADDQVLGPMPQVSAMSAYGGHVVWSQRDPATGRWSLVQWHDGQVTALPVASRSVPFDVDAGPDAHGRPVAVYSRCRHDPPRRTAEDAGGYFDWMQASGCDVYEISLTGGAEHKVRQVSSRRASETTPSIWHGAIAFARRVRGARRAEVLLWRPGARRLRRLRGGSLGGCRFAPCPKGEPHHAGVVALDLGARTVAFTWDLIGGSVAGVSFGQELRVDTLGGRRAGLADSGISSGTCGFESPVGPNAIATGAVFLDRFGDDTCEGTTRTHFMSFALGSRRWRESVPAGGFAEQFARDAADGSIYWIRGPQPDPANEPDGDACRSAPGACVLVRSTGVVFGRAHHRRVDPPTY